MWRKLATGLVAIVVIGYLSLIGFAYWPASHGVPVKSLAATEDRFVEVSGLVLRYQTFGEPGAGRPNIVLMHGFGNSLQSFRNLAPRLADCCHVLALDLPGFGLSSLPVDHDYGNGGQARVAMAAARALGFDHPIYAGHSMGGAIAVHAGVLDNTARALILIDPGIFETGVPKAVSMAPFPFPRMSAKLFGDRAWRERFLKLSFVNPAIVTDAVMDDLMRTPARDDYWAGATAMMGSFTAGNEVELLPKIKIPVLSVFGEADRNHPDALRRKLHDALPGSQLIVVAGAGHYPHEEKSNDVAEAIKTMLKAWGLGGGSP